MEASGPFFVVSAQDGQARAGLMRTGHGEVPTPAFMPVGTRGAVKLVGSEDLEAAGVSMVLANAYHLYLRPGHQLIRDLGGLHRFMAWRRGILTDSGGFQVLSLGNLRRVDDEGVLFTSHLDGSRHLLTPEKVVEIQVSLGSDIAMVLDECPPFPADPTTARQAAERSLRWASRCLAACPAHQPLFAIVQGSTYPSLRRWHATCLADLPFWGFGVGGLGVGEPKDLTWEAVEATLAHLPPTKPRYLMGMGPPEDLLDAISRGIDLFDCVVPTRNGRRGTAYTSRGKVVVKHAACARQDDPLDEECPCPVCRTYSRAYLRHLFATGEFLAARLVSLHNISFFVRVTSQAREAIARGQFASWRKAFMDKYLSGDGSPDSS